VTWWKLACRWSAWIDSDHAAGARHLPPRDVPAEVLAPAVLADQDCRPMARVVTAGSGTTRLRSTR